MGFYDVHAGKMAIFPVISPHGWQVWYALLSLQGSPISPDPRTEYEWRPMPKPCADKIDAPGDGPWSSSCLHGSESERITPKCIPRMGFGLSGGKPLFFRKESP